MFNPTPLNLPFHPFKITQKDGVHYIFDEARKKHLVLTPEEWVRQHFIKYLIKEKQFPVSLMQIEGGLSLNQTRKRSDILIYTNSGEKLMVVKEAQDLKWANEGASKEADFTLAYFEKPLPSTILVLAYKYANFDKRKKIYKAINSNGVVFQSDPVRDYKLVPWIEDHIKTKGYKIDPQAVALMAEYLGTDLSKIANEVEKLCLNIDKATTIQTDHIQRNIGISKEYNVFELQKALATRNVVKSNQIINYFAGNPKANPMIMVMANLNSYFSKILKYHYLPNKGDAPRELGVSPYFIKDYEAAARTFSAGKTFDIISLLREYDLKSKGLESTGNISDGDLLKELVFKILH